jgi:hypothetical protein
MRIVNLASSSSSTSAAVTISVYVSIFNRINCISKIIVNNEKIDKKEEISCATTMT